MMNWMDWMVSSSVLIFVIIALRFLLKGKISLRLQYALWALVLVRLLIPVSIGETAISIGNWLDQISQIEEVNEISEFSQTELPSMTYQQAYEEVAGRYESQGIDISAIPEDEFAETIDYEIMDTMTGEWSLVEIAKIVWILGGVVVGAWFFISNLRFHKKLVDSRQLLELEQESLASITSEVMGACTDKLRIYVTDEVDTPCLFGIFHPAIYVTSEVLKDEVMLRHVIAHETTHYLHRDYIWGYLRTLCLAIHWYNPLVWCAAILSRNDAELACDEATILYLGEAERVSYGRTLIDLTCEKRPAVLLTATTMTGSGKTIKERISMIVKKPKMKSYVVIVVAVVSILCIGCTFTGANTQGSKQDTNINTEAKATETEYTLEGIFTEVPEELREEEQEKLRIELQLRQEEVEQQEELLHIQSESQEFEYLADLTHDGIEESVRVCIGAGQDNTKVKIQVYDNTLKLLYEEELLVHPNLGVSYYLVSCYGNYYLMYYKPSINHDTVSCEYEVFYLTSAGEKVTFDSDKISFSLLNVQELDKEAWKAFADQENMYFKGGFLLVSTNDAVLEYSTNTNKKTYFENFSWLIKEEEIKDIDTVLEQFIQENQ